jgi:hypothetical protein
MCTPDFGVSEAIALASAAASAGGAIMNSNAQAANQANAINAKNKATQDMLAQQAAQQKLATNVFQSTLQPFQDQTPQQSVQPAQAANTSAILANAPVRDVLAGGATSANAPKVVQDSANNSIASRMQKIGQYGENLGNLTGYDTANAGTSRDLKDAALKIGTYGDFAKEDAATGNAAIDSAIANSQKPVSSFGDLLSTAGQLGGYYAGQNGAFKNLFGPAQKTLQVRPVNLTVPTSTIQSYF